MTYNRKEIEQKMIDGWLNDMYSIYHLVMALINFQDMRGLKKLYLYEPDPALDIRKRA